MELFPGTQIRFSELPVGHTFYDYEISDHRYLKYSETHGSMDHGYTPSHPDETFPMDGDRMIYIGHIHYILTDGKWETED